MTKTFKTIFVLFFLLLVIYFSRGTFNTVFLSLSGELRSLGFFFSEFSETFTSLSSLKKENSQLQQALLKSQQENLQNSEALSALQRLQQHYQAPGFDFTKAQVAQIIAEDPLPGFKSLQLDQGSAAGLRVGQVVVAQGALVGRLLKVGPHRSQVLLITDPHSAVAAIDQSSRARGIIKGQRKILDLQRERWLSQAEYILRQEEVKPGDLLLSSGRDGIFPKGLPIGKVTQLEKSSDGLFWRAEVEPQVDIGKLEEVLILSNPVPLEGES